MQWWCGKDERDAVVPIRSLRYLLLKPGDAMKGYIYVGITFGQSKIVCNNLDEINLRILNAHRMDILSYFIGNEIVWGKESTDYKKVHFSKL